MPKFPDSIGNKSVAKFTDFYQIDESIRLKRLHVNTLINPIEVDANKISIRSKRGFIPFLIQSGEFETFNWIESRNLKGLGMCNDVEMVCKDA